MRTTHAVAAAGVGAALAAGLLLGLAGCPSAPARDDGPAAPVPAPANGTAPAAAPDRQITIATWNIQVFGQAKLGKPEVMRTIVDVVDDYDLIAVQEIRDATETTAGRFEALLDATGADFGSLAGPRVGRTSSKEQYAFYWRTDAIELLPGHYTYADPGDRFEREPLVARFQVRGQRFGFVLVNVHTKPGDATRELAALVDVIADVQQRFPDEGDIVLLGDFNADGDYFVEDDLGHPLRTPMLIWAIPDEADTTVAASDNTYDRVVFLWEESLADYADRWTVRRFDAEFGLTADQAKAVSDHYPVATWWWTGKDTR